MDEQLRLLPGYLTAHLQLVLAALAAGVAVSVPLGVAAARIPLLERLSLGIASVVQTVPSLALLAVMVPVLAAAGLPGIGWLPAFLALWAYSALPVLRNTVIGIQGVDPSLTEAADALGMTRGQRLRAVELPLALPVILAGIRTATVWTVGLATLSTPVGATSLGSYLFSGLQTRNHAAILVGCMASAGLALALDGLVQLVATAYARRDRTLALLATAGWATAVVVAILPLIGSRSTEHSVVIGAKTFTEQYILAEVLAATVSSAGATPDVRASLGSTVAFDALVAGEIDAYVDYSGTLYATVLRRDTPSDRGRVLEEVRAELRDRHGIEVVASLGFENTYALAMRRDRAAGARRIGDLGDRAGTMTVGGDYEIFGRPEWRAVRAAYGLAFAAERAMDPSLMYAAVATGDVDIITAFSTDGRIGAYDLVVLQDDRGAVPPYDALVLVGPRLAREHPAVVDALRGLEGTIDADTMRRLNRRVDEDGLDPAAAAHEVGP